MKNKSRKRILHEQKVEIERLRRQIKRLQMQIDPSYGGRRRDFTTLSRSFSIPQGLVETDLLRDDMTRRAMKELIQELVRFIEIRYRDDAGPKNIIYTLSLIVAYPDYSDAAARDYLSVAVKNLKFIRSYSDGVEEMWVPSDTIGYGGRHNGGKLADEIRRIEQQRIYVEGDWTKMKGGAE